MRWLRRGARSAGRWLEYHGPTAAGILVATFFLGLIGYAIFDETRTNARKDRCREASGVVVVTYDNGWACVDHDYRLIYIP